MSDAFDRLTPRDQHLAAHMQRVVLMVQRYLRFYQHRLVDRGGRYTDRLVGRAELQAAFGATPDTDGAWLDDLGVPALPELDRRLLSAAAVAEGLRQRAADTGAPLPIETLRQRFGLSDVALDVLLAAAAPRLSAVVARLYPVAWADFAARQPTASFLAELVGVGRGLPVADVLSSLAPTAPLVARRLVTLHDNRDWAPVTPRLHALVAVPQRIVDALSETPTALEPGRPGCRLHAAADALARAELVVDAEVWDAARDALAGRRARVALDGPVGVGRRSLLGTWAAERGRPVLEVTLGEALVGADDPSAAEVAVSELLREATLVDAVVALRLDAPLRDDPAWHAGVSPRLRAAFDAFDGPVVATRRVPDAPTDALVGVVHEIAMAPPPRERQRGLWRDVLAPVTGAERAAALADELSAGYLLTPGAMRRARDRALERCGGSHRGDHLTARILLDVVRAQLDHRLGWLADVVTVPMRLADIVLEPEARLKVDEILAYARHAATVYDAWGFEDKSPSGRGLSVLLSGPPGTGKTLLGSILAAELGRVLYRVDLSRIVDKYVGETEKNLARVFDEAERAQAVLLFDEADSLFAKRTDVKSSNDRYANLEVNFLLQRLEAYDGVSVLTTNLATSIDEAFQRRIRFKLSFKMPEAAQRAELWWKLVPPRAPRADDIDYDELGECFPLAGGHIKNAVLRAAIIAADRGQPLTHELLEDAASEECRELGMAVRAHRR